MCSRQRVQKASGRTLQGDVETESVTRLIFRLICTELILFH